MGEAMHGQARRGTHRSAEYRSWAHARGRCLNPTDKNYKLYGGRGISMDERWANSFQAFYADMGPKEPGTTLERIDNDEGYFPGNCRWATMSEQCNNRRSNRLITFRGETMNIKQWANRSGVNRKTLLSRILRGWPAERALIA